jgi:hypothetical protein
MKQKTLTMGSRGVSTSEKRQYHVTSLSCRVIVAPSSCRVVVAPSYCGVASSRHHWTVITPSSAHIIM